MSISFCSSLSFVQYFKPLMVRVSNQIACTTIHTWNDVGYWYLYTSTNDFKGCLQDVHIFMWEVKHEWMRKEEVVVTWLGSVMNPGISWFWTVGLVDASQRRRVIDSITNLGIIPWHHHTSALLSKNAVSTFLISCKLLSFTLEDSLINYRIFTQSLHVQIID